MEQQIAVTGLFLGQCFKAFFSVRSMLWVRSGEIKLAQEISRDAFCRKLALTPGVRTIIAQSVPGLELSIEDAGVSSGKLLEQILEHRSHASLCVI